MGAEGGDVIPRRIDHGIQLDTGSVPPRRLVAGQCLGPQRCLNSPRQCYTNTHAYMVTQKSIPLSRNIIKPY